MNAWYPAPPKLKRSLRIGEVARDLDVTVVTIRCWTDWFPVPVSRMGGQRYYPKLSVDKLRLIKFLLRTEGYTVEGARKYFERLISCDW